jgi:hypothetical protein
LSPAESAQPGARSPVDLALRLTLVGLLLRPLGDWPIRAPLLVLALFGLVWPRALRRPALWLALTALTGARVILDWELADNHAYLLAYWCLAIALALGGSDAQRDLATSGRLLVGLVFLFAVLWKGVLAPDFADGRFFGVNLILDPRFEPLARRVGGVDPAQLDALRAFLRTHADLAAPGSLAGPEIPQRLMQLACALTFWTLAIESALAAAFLWPRLARLRDPLLLIFCATTYPVIGIEDFGWLLLAMGVAQAEPQRSATRRAYVVVFALLALTQAARR